MEKARIKMDLKLRPGSPKRIKKLAEEFQNKMEKIGIDTFGRDAANLIRGNVALTKRSDVHRGEQNLMRRLSALYRDAASRRWRELRERMQSSKDYQSTDWYHFKRTHKHKNFYEPYQGTRRRIKTDRIFEATGLLRDQLLFGFNTPGDDTVVKYGNLMVTGYFDFRPESFPTRKRDHGYSYVERLIQLMRTGRGPNGASHPIILGPDENFMEFSDRDWANIAMVMQKIIMQRFIKPLENYVESVEFKL